MILHRDELEGLKLNIHRDPENEGDWVVDLWDGDMLVGGLHVDANETEIDPDAVFAFDRNSPADHWPDGYTGRYGFETLEDAVSTVRDILKGFDLEMIPDKAYWHVHRIPINRETLTSLLNEVRDDT